MPIQTFTYEMKDVSEFEIGDERVVRGLARMKTLPLVPAQSNIRTFDKSRPAVRAMLKQLATKDDGKRFELNNMGGKAQVEKVIRHKKGESVEDVQIFIADEKTQGINQGNHTQNVAALAQQAIEEYPGIVTAWMPMMILTGSTKEQALETSISGNLMAAQNISDQINAAGLYEKLLKELPEDTLAITQVKLGDKDPATAPYTMKEIVRRLALWDDGGNSLEDGEHPTQAYSAPGSVLAKFARGEYDYLIPHVRTILWFLERAQELVIEQNGNRKNGKLGRILTTGRNGSGNSNSDPDKKQLTITGKISPCTVSDVWTFPVVAPFRIFMSGRTLLETKEVLWEKYGLATLASLWECKLKSYNMNVPLNEWCKKAETWEAAAKPIADDCVSQGLIVNKNLKKFGKKPQA